MSHSSIRVLGALVVAAALVTPLALAAEGPFGPIHVVANHTQYTGACPVDVVYTGTVNFTMPHPQGLTFNYHWERSDGAKTKVEVVKPEPGQRSVVFKDTWHLGAPGKHYDASVTLFVNSGNTHEQQSSPVVKINCR